MIAKNLWDSKHDYYCEEGDAKNQAKYETWDEFVAAEGDSDKDYNLVFRWDWRVRGDDDDERNPHPDPYYRADELLIFFATQRKGRLRSVSIRVCAADQPSVKAWLMERWTYLLSLWAPISGEPAQP